MTQVLLSAPVTVDGVNYASGDLVEFGSITATTIIAASLGAAQPAPNGRTINHASRLASVIAGGDTPGSVAVRSQSLATYSFGLSDAGRVVSFTSGSAVAATVPPFSTAPFPLGTVVTVMQQGAGTVTFAPGAGVTINRKSGSALTTGGQYTACQLINTATDVWTLFGALG